MVSSATPTGTDSCAQCSRVALCPWPEPPAGLPPRTQEEALQRPIEGAQTLLHRPSGPRGCRPPVDPRAPEGPHVPRVPVTRVGALTST